MTVYAEHLIAQNELNFGKVFSQQYVLSKEAGFAVNSFAPHALQNGWMLHVGRGLQTAMATDARTGISVAVLGLAVDADGFFIDTPHLQLLLDRAKSPCALADALEMAAGRYIVVITAPDFNRVYLDPSAMISAVYNLETGRVASTLYLAIDNAPVLECEYSLAENAGSCGVGRSAFGYTPDARVRRILANHYFDLDAQKTVRHWPKADCDWRMEVTERGIRERLDRVVQRHRKVIKPLLSRQSPSILLITGGADSRLLLAFAKECWADIDLFCVHANNANTRRDSGIAAQLADIAGLDLVRYNLRKDKSLQKRPKLIRRVDVSERIIENLSQIPPQLRADFYVNDLLMEAIAPELRDVEYTRAIDNEIRVRRAPLAEAIEEIKGPQ